MKKDPIIPAKAGIHWLKIFTSLLIFLTAIAIGSQLSLRKPLWGDETYSWRQSVKNTSYGALFLGKVGEGNNAPLYYVLAKISHDVWHIEERDIVAMRMVSIVSTALLFALLFVVFALWGGWGMGLFALAVGLSTPGIWYFWAEARPYALWMLGTFIQCAAVLNLLKHKDQPGGIVLGANLFLALITPTGFVQSLLMMAWLWILRVSNWKFLVKAFGLPILIGVYYLSQSPRYHFWYEGDFLKSIMEHWPLERLCFWLIAAISFPLVGRAREGGFIPVIGGYTFSLFAVMLAVLGYYFFQPHEGFVVTQRYFVFLSVCGIVLSVCLWEQLLEFFAKSDTWLRKLLWLNAWLWIMISLLRTEQIVLGWYLF